MSSGRAQVERLRPKSPARPSSEGIPMRKVDKQSNERQSNDFNRRSTGRDQDLQKLQEENIKLKSELEDLRSQYEQLIEKGKNECFDERRVILLKAQVMQLERQVVLLTEGLSSRASVNLELENTLRTITEKLRSLLATANHSSEVSVTRAVLIQMIEICQSLSSRLQRNYQATTIEKLSLPWLISERNVTKQPVTLVDLCYGRMENLNLQYVSALEGKLSQLFRHLHAVRQTLSLILAPGQGSHESTHHILPTAIYARLINHVTRCNQFLEECCKDLLTLTLIVPSAPWANLDYTMSQEFSVENVLAILPAFPKGAPQQRAKRAAEALVKAANYSTLMARQQVHALQAELDFHRSVYHLQVTYTEAIFQGIKQAYHTFQDNVVMVLCSPLQDVLSTYADLKTEASDSALRGFLTVFKNNVEQIQDAIANLTPSKNQQHEGDEALSRFGKEFFLSLERSLKECGEQRDEAASQIETLRAELDQAIESLQHLRKERKEKGATSSQHSTKSEVENVAGLAAHTDVVRREIPKEEEFKVMTPNIFLHRSSHLPRSASDNKVAGEDVIVPLQQQQLSSEKLVSLQRNKILHRSKSMKNPKKPPWQD